MNLGELRSFVSFLSKRGVRLCRWNGGGPMDGHFDLGWNEVDPEEVEKLLLKYLKD